MTTQMSRPTDAIESPPCLGEGKLTRILRFWIASG